MNAVNNNGTNAPLAAWSSRPEANAAQTGIPEQSPAGDTVSLSPEARALAAPPAEPEAADAAAETEEIAWGPDLLEGWEDEGYLKVNEDGTFSGSLSMTTKYGTKVGIAAETAEDGSPLKTVSVTIQTSDGAVQRHRIEEFSSALIHNTHNSGFRTEVSGGFLRITENENGIEVTTDRSYTDDDDIIIVTGRPGARGGAGNDTMISLGGPLSGDDGNDTLVALAPIVNTGSIKAGDGNDTIYIRDYAGSYALQTGNGNNKVIIDNALAELDFRLKDHWTKYKENDSVHNDITIKKLMGALDLRGAGNQSANVSIETMYESTVFTGQGNYRISIENAVNSDFAIEEGAIVISHAVNCIVKGDPANVTAANSRNTRFVETWDDWSDLRFQRYKETEAEYLAETTEYFGKVKPWERNLGDVIAYKSKKLREAEELAQSLREQAEPGTTATPPASSSVADLYAATNALTRDLVSQMGEQLLDMEKALLNRVI